MTTLVTIVRSDGDATAAADILRINQPSMSKRLAFLQHAGRILRRPWLERSGKKWQLTEEGRKVFPAVEELVHRYRLLTDAIEEERPAVVFACGPEDAAAFVCAAVGAFRTRHPDTAYRICTRPPTARVEGVANGSLDMASVRMHQPEIQEIARRSLHVEDLCDDPLVLAATAAVAEFADFQALTDRAVTPKALTRFPLIVPEPGSGLRADFDRRCREAGIADRLHIVVEADPSFAAMQFVRDGVGVGVVPRSATVAVADLHVRALPPKLAPPNTARVMCRKRAGTDELDLSDGAVDFLKMLRDAAHG
jgi:DNA-binding transcriptional LysR family regulator